MTFKENLKAELEFKGMKVKELAVQTGINRRTLDQYLATAAKMPSAENAVKIAAALNVSVEYLVLGNETKTENEENHNFMIKMYKKHHKLITNLEKLSKPKQTIIENLAQVLAADA